MASGARHALRCGKPSEPAHASLAIVRTAQPPRRALPRVLGRRLVADWRRGYVEHADRVRGADWETWRDSAFQQLLWDAPAVSGIGPGQSVRVVGADADEGLARTLFDARNILLTGRDVAERSARLQELYADVLARVYPRYTPRRPRARIVRLLAAIFPDDMTCVMDNGRIWGVGRTLGARAVPDAWALRCLLMRPAADKRTIAWHLLDRAQRLSARVFADKAPYALKDTLKAAGYRWSAPHRAWTMEGEPERIGNEASWLAELHPAIQPRVVPLDWHNRHVL